MAAKNRNPIAHLSKPQRALPGREQVLMAPPNKQASDSIEVDSAVLLQAVLETAVDAIVTINQRGIIQAANPACCRMFGYSIEELLGQNVKLLMPQAIRVEHDGYLAKYLATGNRKIIGVGREIEALRKDGTTFPMHLAVSESDVGGQKLFTGIVRDISDLKSAEARLEQMNQDLELLVEQRTCELKEVQAELVRNEKFSTLGKVAGGIAHEIRNPLNAVKTSAYYLLHASQPSVEKVTEHLTRIDRQVTIIDNVITALSDVARLPDANLNPINIIPVLKNSVQSVHAGPGMETLWRLPPESEVPHAFVDETQIVIAFANLVRNARDAMGGGGTLEIKVSVGQNSLRIDFADSGPGVPEGMRDQIFEPLVTTKAKGMGLGLSISKAIVEKNKGKIWFENRPEGGSVFSILLQATRVQPRRLSRLSPTD